MTAESGFPPRIWVRWKRYSEEVFHQKPDNPDHNDVEMISLAEHEALMLKERERHLVNRKADIANARAEALEEAGQMCAGRDDIFAHEIHQIIFQKAKAAREGNIK